MRMKDIKGRKFHYQGEDESGSVYLSECTDADRGVVVRLDKPKSGVPIKLGSELCNVRPDGFGHFSVDDALGGPVVSEPESESNGPAMVATDAYRSGWDRTFGPN